MDINKLKNFIRVIAGALVWVCCYDIGVPMIGVFISSLIVISGIPALVQATCPKSWVDEDTGGFKTSILKVISSLILLVVGLRLVFRSAIPLALLLIVGFTGVFPISETLRVLTRSRVDPKK